MTRPTPPAYTSSAGHPTHFYRMGHWLARNHRWVIGLWFIVLAGTAGFIPVFLNSLTGPPLGVRGSESQRATEMLEQNFTAPFVEFDLLIFSSDNLTYKDEAFRSVVDRATKAVAKFDDVTGVISPYSSEASHQISADGHTAVAIVGMAGSDTSRQKLAPEISRTAQAESNDHVTVYLTGRSPVIHALIQQESTDLIHAEQRGVPLALIVLILAFGSLIAAALPVLGGLIGIAVAFGVLGLVALVRSSNLFVENIATMVGMGVGIDYALFIVTRFREELAAGREPDEAVAISVATSGKTVFFSGATVLVSLSGLALVRARIFADLAIGAVITVGVMVALALTLLPALLSLLGHRINWLSIPFLRRNLVHPDPDRGIWARWAHLIMRRPIPWLIASVIVLIALAAPVRGLELGLETGADQLGQAPAGLGQSLLRQNFAAGSLAPIQVVAETNHGPLTDQDLNAVARLTAKIAADPAVSYVESVTHILDQVAGNHSAATLAKAKDLPGASDVLSKLINIEHGSNATVIVVVTRHTPDSVASRKLVHRMRDTIVPEATGNSDLDVAVGGLSAQITDISDDSLHRLPLVAGWIALLSFLLLAMVFRSIFLPLKAIVMNLLSIGAAYGMLVVVFQQGKGEKILNFQSAGFIEVYLPLLTFAVLFGLSMDYEVFLIGRMKEEWERTHVNEVAVGRGLQHTARVITSAAAIMVVVFATFAFTKVIEIQELGFSLAVAIFVDATIVRIILVPALMRLMGHWNWWFPSILDRVLPHIDISEGSPAPPA